MSRRGRPPKYSEDTVREVRRLHQQGVRQKDIAARLGLHKKMVSDWCLYSYRPGIYP